MNERDRDVFLRWQGRTLDQFSFASNLLLGLSSGAVGLAATALLDGKVPAKGSGWWLFLSATGFEAGSMIVGVGLAWNRLLDFRKTRETVKVRRTDLSAAKVLRAESRELGKGIWRLLAAQTVFFVVGALALMAFVVLYSWR